MTVVTLARTSPISSFFNVQPFVFSALPSTYTLASFWITTFGVPEVSKAETISIAQVLQDSLTNYNSVDSFADLLDELQAFYFATGSQTLSIHTGFAAHPMMNRFEEGHSTGYCDKKIVYIDDIEYKPLLKSFPSIEQSQDIANYEKLSLSNGKIVLNNVGGELDYVLLETIFGNDVNVYYLDDSENLADYETSDLVPIAGYYVEGFDISQQELSISAQDKRKSGEIKIPTAVFTAADYVNIEDKYIDKVIPLAYGAIKASKAIPTNGKAASGSVEFRQALILTALGTVQVKINDAWITKSPTASTLATGSFTLASADARNGTSLYECRVLDSVGIANTHSSEVIVDLNQRYLGIDCSSSNYNLAEWESAEADLETVGVLFDKEVELYEAIRQIQAGSNVGFRYEMDPTGKRSIRIDDWDRAESFAIHTEDISDIEKLEVAANFSLLAARVRVEYAHDYVDDDDLVAIESSNYDYVKETYRQVPTMTIKSLLPTLVLAAARALSDATRFKDVPFTITCNTTGKEFLGLRIYDVGTVEATRSFVDLDNEKTEGAREWLGVWKAQILSIRPDTEKRGNTIRLALTEKKF